MNWRLAWTRGRPRRSLARVESIPGPVGGGAAAAAAAGLGVRAAPGETTIITVHQETLLHWLVSTAEAIGW